MCTVNAFFWTIIILMFTLSCSKELGYTLLSATLVAIHILVTTLDWLYGWYFKRSFLKLCWDDILIFNYTNISRVFLAFKFCVLTSYDKIKPDTFLSDPSSFYLLFERQSSCQLGGLWIVFPFFSFWKQNNSELSEEVISQNLCTTCTWRNFAF